MCHVQEGVLWDGLQQFHIMPDHDAVHRIYKQERVMDFRGDYIENTVSRSKGRPSQPTRRRRQSQVRENGFTSGLRLKTTGVPKLARLLNRWAKRLEATLTKKKKMKEKESSNDQNEKQTEEREKKDAAFNTDWWKARGRRKRQVETDYEIEIFLVADFRDYSGKLLFYRTLTYCFVQRLKRRWLNYYGGNATRTEVEMNLYYAFVANSISQRYRSIGSVDPNLKIDVIITGLLIVNSRDDSYWTENHVLSPGSTYVEASEALDSFRTWVRNARSSLPPSDHWMLFTGYDIYTDKNPNIAGLAKLGGLCSYLSVSIVEQDNTASVGATAAHELGHSLSARHDGEEKDCRDEDNFIMSRKLKTPDAEKLASRPWQFSQCSVKAFREFLSQVKCGQRGPARGSALATELGGGQVFSADLQCQLALGKHSYFGRSLQSTESFSSMCRRLYCAVPGEPGLYQAIFAMEKTTCGDGKWCIQGKCSPDARAPKVKDTCPQGDDPTAPCVEDDCRYYTQKTRDIYCCHTCRQYVTREIILSPSNVPVLIPMQKEQGLPASEASSNASSSSPTALRANFTNTASPPTDSSLSPSTTSFSTSVETFSDLSSTTSTLPTSSTPSSTSTSSEGEVFSFLTSTSSSRPSSPTTETRHEVLASTPATTTISESALKTTPASPMGSEAYSTATARDKILEVSTSRTLDKTEKYLSPTQTSDLMTGTVGKVLTSRLTTDTSNRYTPRTTVSSSPANSPHPATQSLNDLRLIVALHGIEPVHAANVWHVYYSVPGLSHPPTGPHTSRPFTSPPTLLPSVTDLQTTPSATSSQGTHPAPDPKNIYPATGPPTAHSASDPHTTDPVTDSHITRSPIDPQTAHLAEDLQAGYFPPFQRLASAALFPQHIARSANGAPFSHSANEVKLPDSRTDRHSDVVTIAPNLNFRGLEGLSLLLDHRLNVNGTGFFNNVTGPIVNTTHGEAESPQAGKTSASSLSLEAETMNPVAEWRTFGT
ncbi:hypothetical protein C0Q70_07166 [Pomacea canaliculata]|uniref:Peptidase M12B domain-containing protein n=1 Tax=Pomacea canaliculata TaxID=400727 RepID=A0A2T7PEB4_POMCA|nr:hypothetical protein C0Q70_07166 [Pomacea canaliculata]